MFTVDCFVCIHFSDIGRVTLLWQLIFRQQFLSSLPVHAEMIKSCFFVVDGFGVFFVKWNIMAKDGFHYPSLRPELAGDNTARQLG